MLDFSILNKSSKYVLAISGGVDSMVLLNQFFKAGFNFVVCYVDHDKREKSFLEGLLVKKICEENNICFESTKLSYNDFEKEENFQSVARKKRYDFLKSIALKYNIKNIVTAHHGDDQAETIILKLMRGSNLYGYAGIHKVTELEGYTYLRPMLNVSKEEILAYAKKNNILYIDDESNFKDDYKRNRIRHQILPILKEECNNILEKFNEYNEILSLYFDYVRNISKSIVRNSKFSYSIYKNQDKVVKLDILNYLLEQKQINQTNEKIKSLYKNLEENKNFNINIGKNLLLKKEYDNVYLAEEFNNLSKFSYKEETYDSFSSINYFQNGKKIYFSKNNANNNTNFIKLCYNKTISKISVRTRREHDYLLYPYGKKTIKKLFIDLKIPKAKREDILLLVINSNEVIWIPELGIRNLKIKEENLGYLIFNEVI